MGQAIRKRPCLPTTNSRILEKLVVYCFALHPEFGFAEEGKRKLIYGKRIAAEIKIECKLGARGVGKT